MTTEDPLFIASAGKALAILSLFQNETGPLSLAELAARSGYGRSAVQRLVHTLVKLGYMRQTRAGKLYRPTNRCLEFGNGFLRCDWLTERATPLLRALHNECEETVNLTQLVDADVMVVGRFPSRHIVSYEMHLGARLPAYCTAPGRALLAHQPPDVVDDVFANTEWRAHTQHTIYDPDAVRALIAETRVKGYTLQSQELIVGDLSCAVPVLDADGLAVAAINVALPTSRWTLERLEAEIVPQVIQTAHAITNVIFTRT
ncbi:MAG: IclR family transcriptional regulator [Devosiaceae bacterium]|nr:IclR family transcriptional regulator [Devosiaceae bacterium MH13]